MTCTLLAGFEPARGNPNGFLVHRLNHSATTTALAACLFQRRVEARRPWPGLQVGQICVAEYPCSFLLFWGFLQGSPLPLQSTGIPRHVCEVISGFRSVVYLTLFSHQPLQADVLLIFILTLVLLQIWSWFRQGFLVWFRFQLLFRCLISSWHDLLLFLVLFLVVIPILFFAPYLVHNQLLARGLVLVEVPSRVLVLLLMGFLVL